MKIYKWLIVIIVICGFYGVKAEVKDSLLNKISILSIDDSLKIKEILANTQDYIGLDIKYANVVTDSLINACKRIEFEEGLYQCYIRKADVLRFQNKLDDSQGYLDKIIDNCTDNSQQLLRCQALSLKGNVLAEKGNLAEAIAVLLNCVDLAEELKDSSLCAYNYTSLAHFYVDENKYDKALDYYWKSLKMEEKSGNPKQVGLNYFNIGSIYQRRNIEDSALYYYRISEELYEKVNYTSGLAGLASNMGKLLFSKGLYNDAIVEMQKALKYDQEVGSMRYVCADFFILGEFYHKVQNNSLALENLKQCILLAIESKDYEKLRDANKLKSDIYKTQGNFEKSLEKLAISNLYNDTIVEMANQRMVLEVEHKYQNEKREAENLRLKYEKKQQGEVIKLQRSLTIVLMFVLVLVVIFTIFLYKAHDVKKRLNEHLKQVNEKLELLNKTKDRFFRIISHDLKGPFNSIIGFAEILNKEYYELEDGQKLSYLKMIEETSVTTFELINNLLMWAQSQTKDIKVFREVIDLKSHVDYCIGPLLLAAKRKDIELGNRVLDGASVCGDKNLLMTIIGNLVNNSIKFTNVGGRVDISVLSADKYNILVVSDTGIGMKSIDIQRVLNNGELFSNPGTNNEKGTGLGLALCKEFAEINGGKMDIKSEEGKGSEFMIYIPKDCM